MRRQFPTRPLEKVPPRRPSYNQYRKGLWSSEQVIMYIAALCFGCFILQVMFGGYITPMEHGMGHETKDHSEEHKLFTSYNFYDLFCEGDPGKCSLARFACIQDHKICKIASVYYIDDELFLLYDPQRQSANEDKSASLGLLKSAFPNTKIHFLSILHVQDRFKPSSDPVMLEKKKLISVNSKKDDKSFFNQIMTIVSSWTGAFAFNTPGLDQFDLIYGSKNIPDGMVKLLNIPVFQPKKGEGFLIDYLFLADNDLIDYEALSNNPQFTWTPSPLSQAFDFLKEKLNKVQAKKESKQYSKSIIYYSDVKSHQFPDHALIENYLSIYDERTTWSITSSDAVVSEEAARDISSADVLVGSPTEDWLWGMLLARNDAVIIEMEPINYLYWNLAKIVKKKYLFYGSSRLNVAPEVKGIHVFRKRVDSKQKFSIAPQTKETESLIKPSGLSSLILSSVYFLDKKFVTNLPWEQFNNQIIEIKSVCEFAIQTKRIYVLPRLAVRRNDYNNDNQWSFSFDVAKYDFYPMEKYFNDVSMSNQFMCNVISIDNYKTLLQFSEKVKPQLLFNPFGSGTNEDQVTGYYKDVLSLPSGNLQTTPRMYQLNDTEVDFHFGKQSEFYKEHTLALGCAFWLVDFGYKQPYPIERFVDYMEYKSYRKSVEGIYASVDRNVYELADEFYNDLSVSEGKAWIGIHIRRGDYWNKCKSISDERLRNKCFPPVEQIQKQIEDVIQQEKVDGKDVFLYIATNSADITELEPLTTKYRYSLFKTAFNFASPNKRQYFRDRLTQLDTTQVSLFEMLLSSRFDYFIGTVYSSFSRSIIEFRIIDKKPWLVF